MHPDIPPQKLFFVRPLGPVETSEIQTQISAFGSVKTKLIIYLSVMGVSFLLLTGSYNSTSGYFQTTQGAMMGIIFLLVFLVFLGLVAKAFSEKSKISALEKDIKTGLYRIEGPVIQLTPQTVKVGNYTFLTKNFSTSDFKIGEQVFVEFSQGTFHVFSLGKLVSP
jgi:hypothetical protein